MVENKAHLLWAFLFLITISSSVFPSLYQENFLPHISIAIGREQIEQIPISSVFPIWDAAFCYTATAADLLHSCIISSLLI
jgi:hypothetical protein